MSSKVYTEVGILLAVAAGFLGVFYFHIEFGTFVQTGLKASFLVAVSVFTLQFIITRIIRIVRSRQGKQQAQADGELEGKYDAKSLSSRETLQEEFDKQKDSYNKRILSPREQAKAAKKEEEFRRFLGPAWKGKGTELGGEDSRSPEGHKVQGREAAELRHLPDTKIKNIPKPKEPRPKKEKKVLVVPDEPPESDPDCLTVVFRTPLQTAHRRRFPGSATVQEPHCNKLQRHLHTKNVLDYMTKVGFHQNSYTLSTSYPRQNLSDLSSQTLACLGFHKQVVLNVEEKE